MNNAVNEAEAEKPLDPAMERVRKKMARLLLISLAIMMAGLMAVVYAIVYKMSSQPASAPVASVAVPTGTDEISATIALPQGAQINSQSLSGNRILFDLSLADGKRELAIYDIEQKRFVSRFTLTNTGG